MVDNIEVTPGTGATVATDDVGGVQYQRVKPDFGGDGVSVAVSVGAGAVGTGVQRITLASDDPAVTDLAAIEVLLTSMDSDTSRLTSSAGPTAPGGALSTTSFMVGARYNSTPPTFTDGQEGGLQVTSAGRLIVRDPDAVTALQLIDDTVFAEDAAHNSADKGIPALAVRRDAKAVGSGTDGDYSTLNVSADGDLRVDGGKAFIVRVTPTITVPGVAYTANDCFGGEMTITSAARVSGGSGIITGITMSFEDDIAASTIEVLLWDSDPSGTYTDNTALNVADADTYLLLGSVVLDVKTDLGDGALLKATNVNIPYVCNGTANLFATAVIRTSVPTPTATDAAQFTFHLIRD